MSSSSSFLALFSKLLFSFLLSLLFPLILFPSSSISTTSTAAVVLNTNASTYNYKPLPSTHHPLHQICLHQHFSALLQLKRGFDFSYSDTNLSSWNANDSDCCSWEGIHCNPFTGHVISLNLSRLYIGGLLNFQSLFQLRSLERLDLSHNYELVESPIPSGFAQLSNLTHLHLSFNHFYGQIPLDIFHLTRLVSLDLSYNRYYDDSKSAYENLYLERSSSSMEQLFRNLSSLKELFLDYANLSAMGSQWSQVLAYALPNLHKLSLSSCSLSGRIHHSFFRLHSLILLDLSHYNLSSPVLEFIHNLTSLTSLRLSSCNLHHKFPTSVFNLPNLQFLDISYNQFLTVDFPKFSINSTIQELEMSGTKFHGNLADIPRNFRSLTSLRISECNLVGPIPQSFANLSQLFTLDLSYNNFQESIPSLIFTLTKVQYLSLSSNHFNGVMELGSFQNPKNLEWLDLSSNNFSAIINTRNSSASITQPSVNLSQLMSLDFSNNNFQGPIPIWIFELPKLQYLHLYSNNFNGVVDLGSFQNLKNLEQLQLSSNNFSAIINTRNGSTSITQPSVNLNQLMDLDLSNNNFQGLIPIWIFELTELQHLRMSFNYFNGVVDLRSFQNFKNLKQLDLSNNKLTITTDPQSSLMSPSFPRLWYLVLRSCNISNFPYMLRNQEEIEYLDLSWNRIHGKIPQWIWKVGNGSMRYWNLSHNSLEGLEGPFPHLSLTSMQYFDLSSNLLKGHIPMPPASSTFFSIANNKLDRDVPSLICNAKFLELLDLSNNNFIGLVPQCLGKTNNGFLKVLNLGKNAFRGPLFQTFEVGCALETLDLSDNYLEGQMPRSLKNCLMLKVLNLGNNQIHDEFPSQLGNLSNLHVLVLRSNNFFGSIRVPRKNREFFPQLQIIDLSFNNFSGNLPSNLFSTWKKMKDGGSASKFLTSNFSNSSNYREKVLLVWKGIEIEFVKILMAVTVVDFSHNQLEGDIPTSIGELKALHVLNLSHNYFQGKIPSSLQNLKVLESLDLSNNSLSGKIPWQLTELSFLAVLNLSQNQLIGKIPQGRQFDTFGNDSFLGNSNLCGLPLSRKCKENAVAMPPATQSNNEESELDLMHIAFGVGHGVGLGMFFWVLALWRNGRRAFFIFIDRACFSCFSYFM